MGRRRGILTGTLGLILAILVTAASLSDNAHGIAMLDQVHANQALTVPPGRSDPARSRGCSEQKARRNSGVQAEPNVLIASAPAWRAVPRLTWEGAVETAAIEFDLSIDEVRKILEPNWSGPLSALGKRMAATQVNRMAERLAGPTTITVSEAGIRFAASGSERQTSWSEVRALNERKSAWVFQLAPSGIYLIPADAVPAPQFKDFGAHLRALAGSKYKVREGGIRRQ